MGLTMSPRTEEVRRRIAALATRELPYLEAAGFAYDPHGNVAEGPFGHGVSGP